MAEWDGKFTYIAFLGPNGVWYACATDEFSEGDWGGAIEWYCVMATSEKDAIRVAEILTGE